MKSTVNISQRIIAFALILCLCAAYLPSIIYQKVYAAGDSDGYEVVIEENENGVIAFADGTSQTKKFHKGDSVKIKVVPEDGYYPVKYTVLSSSGKELKSKESEAKTFEFTMPNRNVKVSVSLALQLNETEIDVESSDLETSNRQEEIIDSLTAQYLQENVDEKYAKAQKIEFVNIMPVKQTLADRKEIAKDETIDSMFTSSDDLMTKFMGMTIANVAVYNIDDESDYFVAYADTMHQDSNSKVVDYIFALNDNDGNVLDNCIFDKKTGIAYLPKAEYFGTDTDDYYFQKIQLQLMQSIGSNNMESAVQTITTDDDNNESATEIVSEMFDEGVTIQTEPNMDKDELTVSINGVPVESEAYEYDSDSGQIYFEDASPSQFQTVSVNIEEKSILEKIVDVISPQNVYAAISSWDDMEFWDPKHTDNTIPELEIPDSIVTGTILKSNKVPMAYMDEGKPASSTPNPRPYIGYGYESDDSILNFMKYIMGTGTLDTKNIIPYEKLSDTIVEGSTYGLYTIRLSMYYKYFEIDGDKYIEKPGDESYTAYYTPWYIYDPDTKETGSNIRKQITWGGLADRSLRLKCSHVSSPIGTSDNSQNHFELETVYVRFVRVNRTKGYAVVAIATPTTHTQAGSMMIKMKLKESTGKLKIRKVSSIDSSEIVAGAKYTVYTDSDCTTIAKTTDGDNAVLTTTTSNSNTVTLDVGTYYVKETKAASGFEKNTKVYTAKVTAGGTTTLGSSGEVTDTPSQGTAKLTKMSSIDGSKIVAGAEYTVYTDSDCTTIAKTTDGDNAVFVTTDDGSNELSLYIGTYYVKETKAAADFELNSSVYTLEIQRNTLTHLGETGDVTDVPSSGTIKITKKSSVDSSETVSGAEYTIYTDSDCTTIAETTDGANAVLTTTASGSNELTLYVGTYYVKETKAATDFELNSSVYTVTIQRNTLTHLGETGDVTDTPSQGDGQIIKRDSVSNQIVAGAEYTVYTDSACTEIAKTTTGENAVLTTTATNSNTVSLYVGTYYVKETKAAVDYELDSSVHTLVVTRDTTETLNVTDIPYGKVYLTKTSANPSLTDDNNCYSLEDAVYEVYSDSACTTSVGTLTTDQTGKTNTLTLPAGTYYVKEKTASKGYMLCEDVHTVTVTAGQTSSFTCEEIPLDDPFQLTLHKLDLDSSGEAQGTASLEGAIFELDYWDNTDGDTSGNPTRKWYYQTLEDSNGNAVLMVNVRAYYVDSVTLEDGTILKSDPLYTNEFGDITSPLGTFVVKEVVPPKYYQNEGTMRFTNSSIGTSSDVKTGLKFIVALASDGLPCIYCNSVASGNVISAQNLSINVFDESYKGSIKVIKYNESGSVPLEGVSFKLVGDDGSTYEATTNSNGEIVFENLIPQHYVLTETKTLDGLSLLKDNIDIDLPMEMTEQEIADQNADKNQAVWDNSAQAYCFYNLTYEITNEPQFVMPMTGGTQWPLYAGLGAAVAMIGGCMYVILRRKKLS